MEKKLSCTFCSIAQSRRELILYEDELLYIISDIKPKAKVHLLVITKEHIKNCNFLSYRDLDLLNHMKKTTLNYFKENYKDSSSLELGFHVPPFYSVPHLHLHCILPPYYSHIRKWINFRIFMRSLDKQIEMISAPMTCK